MSLFFMKPDVKSCRQFALVIETGGMMNAGSLVPVVDVQFVVTV